MPSFRGSTQPSDRTPSLMSPALAGGFFTTSDTWEAPSETIQSPIHILSPLYNCFHFMEVGRKPREFK